jgi:SP family myo-inositol transporter-like MFS transporter 13
MPDATTVPLIADDHLDGSITNHDYGSDSGSDELLEDDEEEDVDESKLVAPGAFIWGLTICAGVSGLLFGYE